MTKSQRKNVAGPGLEPATLDSLSDSLPTVLFGPTKNKSVTHWNIKHLSVLQTRFSGEENNRTKAVG